MKTFTIIFIILSFNLSDIYCQNKAKPKAQQPTNGNNIENLQKITLKKKT